MQILMQLASQCWPSLLVLALGFSSTRRPIAGRILAAHEYSSCDAGTHERGCPGKMNVKKHPHQQFNQKEMVE